MRFLPGLIAAAASALLACSPAERSDEPAGLPAAPSLLADGQARYTRGEFDSATAAFTAAIDAARGTGDRQSEGRALTWRGLAAWRSGRYADARRDGEAGLAIKQETGDGQELFRSWNGLGLLAWNEGRLLDATALFDSATAAALNPEDLGKAAGNRGLVQVDLGDFAAAHIGFSAMLASGRSSGDARVQGNALTNLAMLDVRVGRPESALPQLAEARRVYLTIDFPGGEQVALAQLATAYQSLGRLPEAFAVIDTAVILARRLNQPQDVAANLEVQAQLHRDVGEERRALTLYDEAQAINLSLGLTVEQGSNFRNQAEILRGLGQGSSAVRTANRALQLHRSAGASFEELLDALLLSEIAADEADTVTARRYLASARELATSLDVRTARVAVALATARIEARNGEPNRVLAVLMAAWPDLTSGGYDAEWQGWDLRAGAEMQLDRLTDAATSAQNAVTAIERVRGGLSSGTQRTGFLARRAGAYARLVEVLLRLNRAGQAFEVADAMRGRALLDHLGGPEPALGRIEAVQEQLSRLEAQGSQTADAVWHDAKRQLEDALARARNDARRVAAQGAAGSGDVLLGRAPAGAGLVRSTLATDEAMLVYFVTHERSYVFVLRRDGLHALDLRAPAEELTARVRLARDMVGRREGGQADQVLEALHELILAPVRDAGLLTGMRRLVLVPHGVLAYLPFAALREPVTGRYLAEDYATSILPSAAALPALAGRPAPGRIRIAGEGFAPSPTDLPATRAEMEAFQQAVPGAALRIGAAATEAEARRAFERAGIVHIASHGKMNLINPLYSLVNLAPGQSGEGGDDGALEVHELLHMRIGSRLVYLSGCETGLGQTWGTWYRAGEDYATLGQALLFAGAGAVVATLWRIDDQAAAVLAERFYQHYRSMPPRDALTQAQRDLIANPRFSNPYYWAGHTLIGGAVAGRAGPG